VVQTTEQEKERLESNNKLRYLELVGAIMDGSKSEVGSRNVVGAEDSVDCKSEE